MQEVQKGSGEVEIAMLGLGLRVLKPEASRTFLSDELVVRAYAANSGVFENRPVTFA